MKEIRCQYTKEGVKTFGKQRLGYAREGKNVNYVSIRWDGRKSWSRYSKSFIDTSPLLALYTDDEIAEITKQGEPKITPTTIDLIEKNLGYIKESGLSEKAIVILLRDYIGANKINRKQIEFVLHSLPKLKNQYLTN